MNELKESILSFETKLEIVTACLAGETTPRRIATGYDIGARTVRDWINIYKTEGAAGLEPRNSNRKYSNTVKESAVKEYLEGSLGQDSICEKYGIHLRSQLRDWIKVYNSGGIFNRKMSGVVPVFIKNAYLRHPWAKYPVWYRVHPASQK